MISRAKADAVSHQLPEPDVWLIGIAVIPKIGSLSILVGYDCSVFVAIDADTVGVVLIALFDRISCPGSTQNEKYANHPQCFRHLPFPYSSERQINYCNPAIIM